MKKGMFDQELVAETDPKEQFWMAIFQLVFGVVCGLLFSLSNPYPKMSHHFFSCLLMAGAMSAMWSAIFGGLTGLGFLISAFVIWYF